MPPFPRISGPFCVAPSRLQTGAGSPPFLYFVVGACAAFGRSWQDASGPFRQIIGTTVLLPKKKISDRFPRPRPSVLINRHAAARSRRARLIVSTDVARASAKVSVPGAQRAVSWRKLGGKNMRQKSGYRRKISVSRNSLDPSPPGAVPVAVLINTPSKDRCIGASVFRTANSVGQTPIFTIVFNGASWQGWTRQIL